MRAAGPNYYLLDFRPSVNGDLGSIVEVDVPGEIDVDAGVPQAFPEGVTCGLG